MMLFIFFLIDWSQFNLTLVNFAVMIAVHISTVNEFMDDHSCLHMLTCRRVHVDGHGERHEREKFDTLARQCAPSVHPDTLNAIIKTESSFNQFAININGGSQLPRQPMDVAEAVATAEYLASNGYNFDAGLGQINSANVVAFGMPWVDVFDACENLGASARVLTNCFVRASANEHDPQIALRHAFSCYNTGNFIRGHQNGYVERVEQSANLTPAHVVVPALGHMSQAFAPFEDQQLPHPGDDASPDAFTRDRLDAFSTAPIRARMVYESFSEAPGAAATAHLTPSPLPDRHRN